MGSVVKEVFYHEKFLSVAATLLTKSFPRWWFQVFFIASLIFGEDESNLTDIFQLLEVVQLNQVSNLYKFRFNARMNWRQFATTWIKFH